MLICESCYLVWFMKDDNTVELIFKISLAYQQLFIFLHKNYEYGWNCNIINDAKSYDIAKQYNSKNIVMI